ncbi:nucleoside monophosphate kinase [Candidatus Microgenomates bacterium]|nr:nucleoside monophosphate kinase [Candidatus Microgenomates bacterium]
MAQKNTQNQFFDLADPQARRAYFEAKIGPEIKKIQRYFVKGNTFIAYLLGKKNAGKGTYAKLFSEIFGENHVGHVSVGDIVRDVHEHARTARGKKELLTILKKRYRGFISIDDTIERLLSRDTKTLLPTEFILALVEHEISKMPKKALFIDGFPRGLDQVSYSLYFRDLIGYREDPDFFVIVNVPEAVIDERIKSRMVCPVCHTPRNLKLMRTKEAGFDPKTKEFYLICDNPSCSGLRERMMAKEGDELGIEPIRERLEMDQKMIEQAATLHGIPKVVLNNSVSLKEAAHFDPYELTPEFVYRYDEAKKTVVIEERPWIIKDDKGVASYSLMAPAVLVSMIRQIVDVLGL